MLEAGSVTRLNLRLVKVVETFGVIRCAITPYGADGNTRLKKQLPCRLPDLTKNFTICINVFELI